MKSTFISKKGKDETKIRLQKLRREFLEGIKEIESGPQKLLEDKKQRLSELKIGFEKSKGKFSMPKDGKEVNQELKDLEQLAPIKDKEALKEIPEEENKIEKPHEVVKAEEEIQKAIERIKKPSKLKSIFGKKREEIKVEMPHVMPRVEEKADPVYLIEEKIHKARMVLMDFKFDSAKSKYIEVMKLYSELNVQEKAKVYQDIKDLYYERKSAEKYA